VPRSRMRGGIPPFPQCVFMAWCLVKHKDNVTFTFIPVLIPMFLDRRREDEGF